MSERRRIGAPSLLVLLSLITTGCGRDGRLPTAVDPRDATPASVASPGRQDERRLETMHGGGHRHLSRHALVAEAKEALGAVLTGEQVHYQRWQTFTDVPDTSDFRAVLGVHLGGLLERWRFSVSGASITGFLARAEGRDGTDAAGVIVTLDYRLGESLVWTVLRRGHPR